MRLVAFFAVLSVALAAPVPADTVIRMDRPSPYTLQAEGFELTRAAEVHIDVTGLAGPRDGWWIERLWRGADDDRLSVYAWVLDAETRRPVWVMSYDDSERISGELWRAEKSLELEPGRYEVYFFSGNAWAAEVPAKPVSEDEQSWWDLFHDNRRRREDVLEDLESCGVLLEIRDLPERDVRRFEVDGALPGSLISRNRMGDSALEVAGFRLDRAAALRVYGLVELREQDRNASDAAWIVDADTRDVVFDAARSRTRRGGGGEKNRLIDLEIELEAGHYLLYYGTDDSHSFEQFNVNAPWDPYNWGVTLLAGEGFDADAFSTFEPEETPALIDLTGIGESRTVEQAFRLDTDSKLWIQASGEYDDDDEAFYDGAWIVDAATGKSVWEMTERNTRGAGGADKNRAFDGLVDLPRGSYVVYYATDGTHSYPDWNAAAPFRPEAWGVSVRPARGTERPGLALLDEAALLEAGGYIVRLVGVGDDARRRERFTLDVASRLRVHALGEGQSGRMYDYAYIVADQTGRVWEMEYDATRHAGGADKNRMTDEEIDLEPGSYEVVYVSDGSHSAEGWNAGPPRDPINWGVTLRLVSDL